MLAGSAAEPKEGSSGTDAVTGGCSAERDGAGPPDGFGVSGADWSAGSADIALNAGAKLGKSVGSAKRSASVRSSRNWQISPDRPVGGRTPAPIARPITSELIRAGAMMSACPRASSEAATSWAFGRHASSAFGNSEACSSAAVREIPLLSWLSQISRAMASSTLPTASASPRSRSRAENAPPRAMMPIGIGQPIAGAQARRLAPTASSSDS